MSEEGEFKKRFSWHAFKTTWETEKMTQSKDSILIDTLDKIHEDAKKEIFDAIEQHITELVDFWKLKSDPQKQKMAQYYIDAYLCIKHNVLEEDKFKLKKWFGEQPKGLKIGNSNV